MCIELRRLAPFCSDYGMDDTKKAAYAEELLRVFGRHTSVTWHAVVTYLVDHLPEKKAWPSVVDFKRALDAVGDGEGRFQRSMDRDSHLAYCLQACYAMSPKGCLDTLSLIERAGVKFPQEVIAALTDKAARYEEPAVKCDPNEEFLEQENAS